MSYTVTLYKNTSGVNYVNKVLTSFGDVACEFKNMTDVEEPEVYIAASDAYDDVNYLYIPQFGRYYFATPAGGRGSTITYKCKSDPLMSFKLGILTSPVVVARNPWKYDKYIHDDKLPIESRCIRSTFAFPVDWFQKGKHNCYILTTLGGG